MVNNTLGLKPAKRKIMPVGKYEVLIRKFILSGKEFEDVDCDDAHNAYLGLRKWVKKMGLLDKLYVRKDGQTVQLQRR